MRCVRVTCVYARHCSVRRPGRYVHVRTLQLQDPPNRLPIGSSTPTPASGTPPTPNGVPARVSFGREHHPPAVRPSTVSPTSILTSAFLFFSTPRPLFLSLFSFFLSLYLSLLATSALTSLCQTREYARTSNRAYCRGYTPIDPEVPSNGQLENQLGFPRSHLARPSRPLVPPCGISGS